MKVGPDVDATVADDSDLRGSAYRQAAHAVVAWSLGLEVQGIHIGADDDGDTVIGTADRLPLVDQIALIVASREAESFFENPITDGADFDDLKRLIGLLKAIPEKQSAALRAQGRNRARQRLAAHWVKIIRLAERLIDVHHVNAAEFLRLIS